MKQRNKSRKSAAGSLITGAVAWVLSFLLVLLTMLGVVGFTVCNQRYLRSQVLESGFCKDTLEQLNENYVSYGNAGGIPAEVMTSIVSEDQIQQDMFRAVESLYDGDRRMISHPEVAQAAVEAIEANLESRGIQLTDEIRSAVQEMANGCQVDYDNYVQILIAPYVAPYMSRVSQMVWTGFGVLALVSVAALMILLALQRSAAARLRWCINAFSAAALASVLAPLLFDFFVNMERLNLKPENLKTLIASYTHGAVDVFFYFALIYVVVVIALTIAWRAGLKQYRLEYRRRKEEREQF